MHRWSIAAVMALFVGTTFAGGLGSPCLDAPPLPAPSGTIVNVSTAQQLQSAVSGAGAGTTILLAPGTYAIGSTLNVFNDDITIRGDSDSCDAVIIEGPGMNVSSGPQHGISAFQALNLTVANLTIRGVYNHAIQLQWGSDGARIYNVKLLDSGEQFIKANPQSGSGNGAADVRVEYSILEYTNGTPSHGSNAGYTNCMSLHSIDDWVISNNLFKNVHNPDTVQQQYWHVPCILAWNGASDTVIENNTFVDCDRAIALGLCNGNGCNGHTGGVIRNNFIYMSPNMFSAARRNAADGVIIGWKAPGAQVLHNTIVGNDNHYRSIEFRLDTSGAAVRNNLVDLPVGGVGVSVTQSDNVTFDAGDQSALFDAGAMSQGDLHLLESATLAIDQVPVLATVGSDFDGDGRPQGALADAGADERTGGGGGPGAPPTPTNLRRTDVSSAP